MSAADRQRDFVAALTPVPGTDAPVAFDSGWRSPAFGGEVRAYLTYATMGEEGSWSEEHEALHEEPSRSHFIDVYTRRAALKYLAPALRPEAALFCDFGCSTGYLLEDVRAATPGAVLIGSDLVASGLRKCHARLPEAMLFQLDVCKIPFGADTLDALASLNLLEHVPADEQALSEFFRVLRPGGIAYVVVPAGPRLYDYYDEVLLHERRYARSELVRKATRAGFRVRLVSGLAAPLYPAFWLTKKWHRWRHGRRTLAEKRAFVERDIAATMDSRVGHFLMGFEHRLPDFARPRFGVRYEALLEKP